MPSSSIQVNHGLSSAVDPGMTPLLTRAVQATLRDADADEGELSLTLVDDPRIRALNREYLGHDRVTDVISFSLHGDGEPLFGDIYIGYEQAVRQAKQLALPIPEELVRLAIHGTLHVLGHDHPSDERFESVFFRRQEKLVHQVLAAARAGVAGEADPSPCGTHT